MTVNAYRPGSVDTAMQAWIRQQDPDRIGNDLHQHFTQSHQQGNLITDEHSARNLIDRLSGTGTGAIWDVSDPIPPSGSMPSQRQVAG